VGLCYSITDLTQLQFAVRRASQAQSKKCQHILHNTFLLLDSPLRPLAFTLNWSSDLKRAMLLDDPAAGDSFFGIFGIVDELWTSYVPTAYPASCLMSAETGCIPPCEPVHNKAKVANEWMALLSSLLCFNKQLHETSREFQKMPL